MNQEDMNKLLAYYDKLLVQSIRLTGNKQDAEDILHNAYMRAFDYGFRNQDGLYTWLYRILKNTFNNYKNRNKVYQLKLSELDQDPTSHQPNNLDLNIYFSKINQLPGLQKECFSRFLLGFLYREIAEELKIDINAVKRHIYYSRRSLGV